MSVYLSGEAAKFEQRILAVSGLYKGQIDGLWGPLSNAAYDAFTIASAKLRSDKGSFDARTEKNIATLTLQGQRLARDFMNLASSWARQLGLTVQILSGTRTYPEQSALYAQGRTTPGPRVTNAPAGSSNHNFGIAWDVGIFRGGHYYTGATHGEEQAYIDLAHFIKGQLTGLEWGGDWHSIKDNPHYQLATGGKSISQVRAAFESGTAFV